jgi:hypothetical protein
VTAVQVFDESLVAAHTIDGVAMIPPGHYESADHPLVLPNGLTVRAAYSVRDEPDPNRWSVIHTTSRRTLDFAPPLNYRVSGFSLVKDDAASPPPRPVVMETAWEFVRNTARPCPWPRRG